MEQSPILIVDDDEDELEMIEEASATLELNRAIHFFKSGKDLIHFLEVSERSPFFILCDVNLLCETGFEVKKRIADHPELRYKSVPFIFWSTAATAKQIQHAYDLPVQGFFEKPNDFTGLCESLKSILDYWQRSLHPTHVV